MKQFLFTIIFVLYTVTSFSQSKPSATGYMCFDGNISTYWGGYLNYTIDTLSNANNIWQTGKAHKSVFDSLQIVMVTDTANPYPINDTSSFILEQKLDWHSYSTYYHWFDLEGSYWVNSDSLTDYGKIEISMKGSNVWEDVMYDTVGYDFFPNASVFPVLSGNSNGWKQFSINFIGYGIVKNLNFGDTMLIRFTFISDSIQTNKDGLMFGCFQFNDWFESVQEIRSSQIPSQVYPNPASSLLTIAPARDLNFKKAVVDIFDQMGRKVKTILMANNAKTSFSVADLPNGLYHFKVLYDNNYFSSGKFSVIK